MKVKKIKLYLGTLLIIMSPVLFLKGTDRFGETYNSAYQAIIEYRKDGLTSADALLCNSGSDGKITHQENGVFIKWVMAEKGVYMVNGPDSDKNIDAKQRYFQMMDEVCAGFNELLN